MKNLDITKPMIERGDPGRKYRFVSYIMKNGEKHLLLFWTDLNGNEYTRVTQLNGSWFETDELSMSDVINVPEEPEFSWDKPIRHIVTGDVCVFKVRDKTNKPYPWTLTFKDSEGDYRSNCYDYNPTEHLENYEPEERYEVVNIVTGIGTGNCRIRYCVFDKTDAFPTTCKITGRTPIAEFCSKEDAEKFRQLKEQEL